MALKITSLAIVVYHIYLTYTCHYLSCYSLLTWSFNNIKWTSCYDSQNFWSKILICSKFGRSQRILLKFVMIGLGTGVINARDLSLVLDSTVRNVRTLICALAARFHHRFRQGYCSLNFIWIACCFFYVLI
jgi:hypothetical protein